MKRLILSMAITCMAMTANAQGAMQKLEQEAKEKARTLGLQEKVLFLGQMSDVSEWYHAMDCFVLPSLFEGLGIVLIEAQACGLTCFVSDVVPRQVDAGGCRFFPLETGAKA